MRLHEWTNEELDDLMSRSEEPEPVELNSLSYFVHALSYFEEEVSGKLSPPGQSPTSSGRSESCSQRTEFFRSVLLNEETSQLLIDPGSTRGHGSEASLLEDPHDDDSITRLHVDAIEINEPSDIIGTNSRITCHYQMSDPNLRWVKD